ncbi:acyl-ACP desaturase [Streptomyces sp. NPDC052676]|uniref:acyl-ACP desaturase n=1 Tax=Streptomyces sp. NPDC052676 TaxID=3154953 RepID=UPI0034182CA4
MSVSTTSGAVYGMLEKLDVLAELEPCVARNLDRHLARAAVWYPHQYIPWSAGRDLEGPLGGEPWEPEQSVLPGAVRDALMANPLTADNLPSYHHEIASRFGHDGDWGTRVHRWSAEEDRHSHALRAYQTTTRAVHSVALEQERIGQMSRGFTSDQPTALHAIAYVTVQELATRIAHRNAGRHCPNPVGASLTARIAADENLRMVFYRDLCRGAFELAPAAFLSAFTDVVCAFRMPGHGIPRFTARAARIAAAGIFDVQVHCEQVLRSLVRALGVMDRADIGPSGEQAREKLGVHLEHLRARSARLSALRLRLTARQARHSPHGEGET